MKTAHWIVLSMTIAISVWAVYRSRDTGARVEVPIDLNWTFIQGDQPGAQSRDYNDSDWQFVSIPHDWMIQYPVNRSNPSGMAGGYYPGGIGWYRKTMDLSEFDGLDRFQLLFEGVYMNADVWFNGTHLGKQVYGYSSFHYDISDLVRTDTVNVLAVRTDCSKLPADRWYSGAGIYRPVRLIATRKLHVPIWGTSVTSTIDSLGNAHMEVSLEVENHGRKSKRFELRYDLVDSKGRLAAEGQGSAYLKGGQKDTLLHSLQVESPALWSPDNPELYQVNCYLMDGNDIIDHVVARHGFRSANFDPDRGFVLNGEKVVLKGVCLHHDGGALGAAVPMESWKRRLKNLKLLGVNAIRFAHNPHAPGVLKLCDEMGFLVINEIYDKWSMPWKGAAVDMEFESNWEKDLEYFIRRDRNHPSVILWSVGNETIEQLDDPAKGREIYGRLMERVRSLDPSREVSCALQKGKRELGHELPSSMMELSPVVSYNYLTDSFPSWHRKYPKLVFIATETRAYGTSLPEDFNEIDFMDNSWNDMEEYVAGQFIWTGIDYLGESSGWPDRGFRTGLMWTNGFIKPYAWYVASNYREDPMVKLTVKDPVLADSLNQVENFHVHWAGPPLVDHWTFPNQPGEKEVVLFSNSDSVDLHLNDSLYRRLYKNEFPDGVMRSTLPYEKGKLVARAYHPDERGRTTWVADSLTSSQRPYSLAMVSDRKQISANSREVFHITTEVRDSVGVLHPHSEHLVNYKVDGPGQIRVIDNGDLADHGLPTEKSRELRRGKQLLILQAGSEPGDLIISASAEGLQPSKVKIKTRK